MRLQLANLDDRTRPYMLEELERDLSSDNLYDSPRLSAEGHAQYPMLLRSAIQSGDDGTLADSLRSLLVAARPRRTKGGYTMAKLPEGAEETLAEGEFNRYYARGLCLRALADGIDEVVVYRAKAVRSPRPDSQAMIGQRIPAERLLEDLRTHPGIEPALGLPKVNSGLSIRLPTDDDS